jgi:hypothetical protein
MKNNINFKTTKKMSRLTGRFISGLTEINFHNFISPEENNNLKEATL